MSNTSAATSLGQPIYVAATDEKYLKNNIKKNSQK